MARAKRTKNEGAASDPAMSRSVSPEQHSQQDSQQGSSELCPACVHDQSSDLNFFEKERWVRCDACKVWYHWRCVGKGEDIDSIDKWCAALPFMVPGTANNILHVLGIVRNALTQNRPASSLGKHPLENPTASGHNAIMLI